LVLENVASSRAQLFIATEAIARKILQHCAPVDFFSCFADLE
jgi:hypothetical protein